MGAHAARAESASLHTLQLGGPRCEQGPKIQSSHHFALQRKLRPSKLKYEALEISEVRGHLDRKVLMLYSYFGLRPFESNVLYTLQLL